VTCPQGKTSISWHAVTRGEYPFSPVQFSMTDCRVCPVRAQCTRAATQPRQRALRPREEHLALQAARLRQTSEPFRTRYRKRAGVEGTMAHGAPVYGARRARYRSLPKVRLEHVAIATAISLQQREAWWTETPPATTRISRFAALAA
jgi:Transposase DDE domain